MAEDFTYRAPLKPLLLWPTAIPREDRATYISVNINDRVEQPDGGTSPELTTDLVPAFNAEREAQMFSTFTVD